MSGYYTMIAGKIERDPKLVGEALSTLTKWERIGNIPQLRARQWRRLLRNAQKGPDGLRQLLAALRDNSEDGMRLKDFGPFAGMLSRKERRRVFLKCVFSR